MIQGCDDLYLHTVRYTPMVLNSFLKGACGTPLVVLTLKFQDLPFSYICTPTPSVYAHLILRVCTTELNVGLLFRKFVYSASTVYVIDCRYIACYQGIEKDSWQSCT